MGPSVPCGAESTAVAVGFPWDPAGNSAADPQRAVELRESLPALLAPGLQGSATLPARGFSPNLAPGAQNEVKLLHS